MLLLSIPKPCHENWDAMLPNEKGAFCNACAKTVVDFTGMSDDEVTQYFTRHQGQKTCGRFNITQVPAPGVDLPALFSSTLPYWKKFLAVVFIAFGSLLTGCDNNIAGEIAMPQPAVAADTSRPATRLVGDTVVYTPPVSSPRPQKPACSPIKGKVLVQDSVKRSSPSNH